MRLNDFRTITSQVAKLLEADKWTVDKLATATVKDLTGYTGIGKVTAEKIIAEAGEYVNQAGLSEAERLERERYLATAPVRKIVEDLAGEGFSLDMLALLHVSNLEGYKLISHDLAKEIISFAQKEINRQKLFESRAMATQAAVQQQSGNAVQQQGGNSAFPVEWLSGQVNPPPMSVRVRRAFEQAKAAYKVT